jgi:hypothetical protein
MKKILFNVFLFLTAILVYAKNTKNIRYDAKAEVRKVDEFKGIEVANSIALYLSQGRETTLAVSVKDNASKMKTEEARGASSIHYRGNMVVKNFEASGTSSIK